MGRELLVTVHQRVPSLILAALRLEVSFSGSPARTVIAIRSRLAS
jgi:hypothetical protein